MKKYLELFIMELKMMTLARWRYKMNMISDIIMIVGIFIIVFFCTDDQTLSNYYHLSVEKNSILLFMGYLFWQFASLALGFSTSIITSEASEGVLEVKVQSVYNIIFLYFIKLLVSLISNFLIFISLIAILPLFAEISLYDILYFLLIVIINIPSIIGMYGIGLMISSFTIKEKKGSNLVLIIQSLLIFISNVTRPLQMSVILLIPYSLGIELSRKLYSGISVLPYEIILYIFINIIWLVVGMYLFNRSLENTRRVGSFDTY